MHKGNKIFPETQSDEMKKEASPTKTHRNNFSVELTKTTPKPLLEQQHSFTTEIKHLHTTPTSLGASSLFGVPTSPIFKNNLIFTYLQQAEDYLELHYPSYFKKKAPVSTTSFANLDEISLSNWKIKSHAKLKKTISRCCQPSLPDEVADFYLYLDRLEIKTMTLESVRADLMIIIPALKPTELLVKPRGKPKK